MLVAMGETDGSGTALARASELAVPTAHHLLGGLVDAGLLARDGQARYVLGPAVAALAEAYQRELAAPEFLLAPLRELANTSGETTYLVAWRRHQIRVLAVAEGSNPVRVVSPTDPYRHPHARASGKLLLAHASEEERQPYLRGSLSPLTPRTLTDQARLRREFDEILDRGWAIDEEEFQPGVCCLAAPILDAGLLIAAYSMSVPVGRFRERKDELLSALIDTTTRATDPESKEVDRV